MTLKRLGGSEGGGEQDREGECHASSNGLYCIIVVWLEQQTTGGNMSASLAPEGAATYTLQVHNHLAALCASPANLFCRGSSWPW
jgi:hypothetical protein